MVEPKTAISRADKSTTNCAFTLSAPKLWNKLPIELRNTRTLIDFKVTVQFKTEGNGQNEIVSHMDRSEVISFKIVKKNCDISYTEQDFETNISPEVS